MAIKSLEEEKKEFYSYALYIQDARGYKSRWLYVIFREYFGETLPQEIIDNGKPHKPSQQFMEWLNSTLVRTSNDGAKILEQRARAETSQKAQKQPKSKPKDKKDTPARLRVDRAIYDEIKSIAKAKNIKLYEAFNEAMYDYIKKNK